MNAALKITFDDLARTLQKTVLEGALGDQLHKKSNALVGDIITTNARNHPDLRGSAEQTGPLSFSLSFTAPGLWNSTYGSQSQAELGFETRVIASRQETRP